MDKLIRFFRPRPVEEKTQELPAVTNTEPADVVLYEALPQDNRSLEELLGNTASGAPDPRAGERMYQRPPYEETKAEREAIAARVDEMDLEKLTAFIGQLKELLIPIAKIEAQLRHIPTLYWIVEAIEKQYSKICAELRYQGRRPTIDEILNAKHADVVENESLNLVRLKVVENLTYAISFSEGLFGPNDLGYLPDTSTSLARREEIIFELVERSAEWLAKYPNLFGEDTQEIYNGIVARLNQHRSTFHGSRVSKKEFPAFPG